MTGAPIQNRCWNHEAREAVCRCPECGRSYCRECVTEHEARLLCAACLRGLAKRAAAKRGARRWAPVLAAAAGLALAWAVYFAAGEALITFSERAERPAWQAR